MYGCDFPYNMYMLVGKGIADPLLKCFCHKIMMYSFSFVGPCFIVYKMD